MAGLPTVTSAKGDEYSVDSPQGKMILSNRNRAAAGAAKAAVSTNSFMEDSSTVAAGFIVVDKHLQTISDNVVSIGESVETMVMIAQADTRGDALNSANVTQDDLKPGGPDEDGVYRAGAGGGDGDGDGGLGGLMGIGAVVGGFGKGLSFWGTPLAIAGAVTFLGFLGGLILIGWAGAKVFRDSADDIAAGMEVLSAADVDTEKVVGIAKALASMGGALAAEGLGAAIGSIGSLVSGVVDGLGGLLGIDKRDPMEELKAFAQHPFTETEIKQIELNALIYEFKQIEQKRELYKFQLQELSQQELNEKIESETNEKFELHSRAVEIKEKLLEIYSLTLQSDNSVINNLNKSNRILDSLTDSIESSGLGLR